MAEFWTVNALSVELGIDRRTVGKRLDGVPPAREDDAKGGKFYRLRDVLPLLVDPPRRPDGQGLDPAAERAALDRVRRELLEHQLAERRGEYANIEAVSQRWEKVCGTIRQKLLGLPSKLAKRLEHRSAAEVSVILGEEVRQALAELSGGTPNRATRRATKKGGR